MQMIERAIRRVQFITQLFAFECDLRNQARFDALRQHRLAILRRPIEMKDQVMKCAASLYGSSPSASSAKLRQNSTPATHKPVEQVFCFDAVRFQRMASIHSRHHHFNR
jgi:hypothetical protein